MTDALDTLRPEVREAVALVDFYFNDGAKGTGWPEVRAELLRLQSTESRANEWQLRAERAEAELGALKAKIADGWLCGVSNDKCPGNFDAAIYCLPSRFRGKRVRLVVEE